jgi:small subunit ribosomal protein S5
MTETKQYEKNITNDWLKTVIYVKQVSSGNSGGRLFMYAVMSIVGNKKNKVGIGYGKARTVVSAIQKSFTYGIKHAEVFSFGKSSTIPFQVNAHYHSSKIMLKPTYNGAGLKCNFVTRNILMALGISNISSKAYGTKHKKIKALATLEALRKIDYIKKIQLARKNTNTIKHL